MIDWIHPEALAELESASRVLDEERRGLGVEFATIVRKAFDEIVETPSAWPKLDRTFRMRMVRRFHYKVVYRVVGERILIFAIAHHARRPGYWKSRNKDAPEV